MNNAKDPEKSVKDLQAENNKLKKQIDQLLSEKAGNIKGDLKAKIKEVNGIHFLAEKVDLDANAIKDVAFQLGGEVENLFLVLASDQKGKALMSCYISKDLVKEKDLNAGQIIRELGKHIQGGGGGQPFFATTGGKNPEGIAQALAEAEKYMTS